MSERVSNWVLLLMVGAISLLFFYMIRSFLMTIFLAGLFSALSRPLYHFLLARFYKHRHFASVVTILIILLIIVIPLIVLISIVSAQAIEVGQTVVPFVKNAFDQPDMINGYLKKIPFYDTIAPFQETLLKTAGDALGMVSGYLVSGLSSVTLGAVNAVFLLFVLLYTMFFFLMDGEKLVHKILFYFPLDHEKESQILEKFTSVTRATIKGTFLISLLQGGLAGIAFAVAGIPNAVFWGALMAVLSVIPSVGSALVWAPASIILILQGNIVAGVGLLLFCALIVGSIDNVLRPILVGKDTKMHELMIFFSTMGGIVMFGIVGLFIGPLIASIFITLWEMYGVTFGEYLPEVGHNEIVDHEPFEEELEGDNGSSVAGDDVKGETQAEAGDKMMEKFDAQE